MFGFVIHTYLLAQFQEKQLKSICLGLGFWGDKGEFSHRMSTPETSIKNTGGSKTIMKGVIMFQAPCGVSETNSAPAEFPCTVFPEEKKKVTLTEQSHDFATFNTSDTKRSSATGAS